MKQYILVNKKVVECDDLKKWTEWLAANKKGIALSTSSDGKFTVSTVFLGLDYSFSNHDATLEPLVFETMVFENGADSVHMDRYCNWDDAINGHIKVCKRYFGKYTKKDLFVDCL